jgi:hypothetical protein
VLDLPLPKAAALMLLSRILSTASPITSLGSSHIRGQIYRPSVKMLAGGRNEATCHGGSVLAIWSASLSNSSRANFWASIMSPRGSSPFGPKHNTRVRLPPHIKFLDVHLIGTVDAIHGAGIATNHLEISEGLELLLLVN